MAGSPVGRPTPKNMGWPTEGPRRAFPRSPRPPFRRREDSAGRTGVGGPGARLPPSEGGRRAGATPVPLREQWSPGLLDRFNDPSAGSPTETLLRLLLPLDRRVQRNSQRQQMAGHRLPPILALHQHIQSVGATGGVYKGQGRSQRELMTRAY